MKWAACVLLRLYRLQNVRFGEIEAHEAINAAAREMLLVAKEIAEADGFELLHALVDSLYVWKDGATREDQGRLPRRSRLETASPWRLSPSTAMSSCPFQAIRRCARAESPLCGRGRWRVKSPRT
jgi:hypothetical protein